MLGPGGACLGVRSLPFCSLSPPALPHQSASFTCTDLSLRSSSTAMLLQPLHFLEKIKSIGG